MPKCQECRNFFIISEDADDYEPGKGDCVIQKEDDKGRYWLSKPVFESADRCATYLRR